MKKMESKNALRVAILVLLLLALLPGKSWGAIQPDPLCAGGRSGTPSCSGSAAAGYIASCSNGESPICPGGVDAICNSAANPTCPNNVAATCPISEGLINPDRVIFSGHSGAAQSILAISLLIMLVMSFAIGIMYSIGYAFRIDKLLRFAKAEVGELLLTLLIVVLFVGSFTVTPATITSKNFFAVGNGALNNGIFTADCTMLVQQSFNLVPVMFTFGLMTSTLNMIGSTTLNFDPNFIGVLNFKPILGISALTTVTNTFMYGTSGFTVILMGAATFIVMIYALFPLFLYLGIILRTLPWTRPAGGAFLGMFIAFYILFPLLIYSLLFGYAPYVSTPGLTLPTSPVVQSGPAASIIATCPLSVDHCQVLVDSTLDTNGAQIQKAQSIGTATFDASKLAPGCYSVAANDMTTDEISLTQTAAGRERSGPVSNALLEPERRRHCRQHLHGRRIRQFQPQQLPRRVR